MFRLFFLNYTVLSSQSKQLTFFIGFANQVEYRLQMVPLFSSSGQSREREDTRRGESIPSFLSGIVKRAMRLLAHA